MLGLAAAVVLFVVIFVLSIELTPFDSSKLTDHSQATVVYAKDNAQYMTVPGTGSNDLTYDELPKNLQNALIATEDHNFWDSSSIDVRGLMRATFVDLWSQRLTQGGSTIQEQLAKIVYLNDKKTFGRKIKQITLGIQINRYFTKQEILAMYLNKVYLGESCVGVEDAAARYFGIDIKKNPDQLTLSQAALLAGLPQAPSSYDPITHKDAATQRRNQVLENMVKYGYIKQADADAAEHQAVNASYHKIPGNAWDRSPQFTNFLYDYVSQEKILSPEELAHGGLKIYTTLDPTVQSSIDKVFMSTNYDGAFPGPTSGTVVQGAALFVDPKTGGILGGAGSRKQGFQSYGEDRIYSMRQPGSSIKPIMEYAPAIESGKFGPDSILNNTPHDFGGGYVPQNDSANAPAKVTMQYGLQWSENVAAVWLLQQIGIRTGADFAERDGIKLTANDRQHLGIAIGGLENGVSPMDMAQAYEPFANQGVQMKTHLITKIVNAAGDTLYEFKPETKRIMSAQTAQVMTQMMQQVVNGGTGQPAQVPGWDVAGKTGTVQYDSNQSRQHQSWISSAWFDGYTPNMVGSIYMGYDVPTSEHHLTDIPHAPSWYCAQLFGDIVKLAVQGQTPQQFGNGGTQTPVAQPVSQLNATWDDVARALQLTWKTTPPNQNLYYIVKRSGPMPLSTGGNPPQGGDSGNMTTLGQTNQPSYEDVTVQQGYSYTYTVQAVDSTTGTQLTPAQSVTVNISNDGGGNPTGNQTGNATSRGDGGNLVGNSAGGGTDGNTTGGTGDGTGTNATTPGGGGTGNTAGGPGGTP